MGLPDCQLDEPSEPETCEMHNEPRPCRFCKERMDEWTFNDWREER